LLQLGIIDQTAAVGLDIESLITEITPLTGGLPKEIYEIKGLNKVNTIYHLKYFTYV
jgi:hypothetical protein